MQWNITFRHVIIIFVVILLNACSTIVSKKDGPPPFFVDETKIPNAQPKVEPLSRIGNKPSYHVFGKRYHVMSSSKNYDERGIASWYGTKFHDRHTSNGEVYNMLAMTAAHKSLPLPTYVQVTNLKNGKNIIVKVNDRGPFEANRIIDLSYVAAKKLGMLGRGTAYVRVKAIDARAAMRNRNLIAKNKMVKGTYLQVGAFHNKAHAELFKKRIMRFASTPVQITRPSHLYRVQIGPLRDASSEDKLTRKLKTLGMNTHKVVISGDDEAVTA